MRVVVDERMVSYEVEPSLVRQITFFLRDRITVDQACFEIRMSNEDVIVINEDSTDFLNTVKWLQEQLPEMDQNWERLMFVEQWDENRTVIYEA